MTGARDFGPPCQHAWRWRWTATRSPHGATGNDHEALTGFDFHDLKCN
jgi:hypothetical protein